MSVQTTDCASLALGRCVSRASRGGSLGRCREVRVCEGREDTPACGTRFATHCCCVALARVALRRKRPYGHARQCCHVCVPHMTGWRLLARRRSRCLLCCRGRVSARGRPSPPTPQELAHLWHGLELASCVLCVVRQWLTRMIPYRRHHGGQSRPLRYLRCGDDLPALPGLRAQPVPHQVVHELRAPAVRPQQRRDRGVAAELLKGCAVGLCTRRCGCRIRGSLYASLAVRHALRHSLVRACLDCGRVGRLRHQ